MPTVLKRYRLGEIAIMLAVMVLADCAGKHQTAMQEERSAEPAVQAVSETPPPAETEPEPSPEPVAIEAPKVIATSVREKKLRFFGLLRPIVETENADILKMRRYILRLKGKRSLRTSELDQLRRMAAEYRVSMPKRPNGVFWTTMLKRIDIIPMELVLAQAANESAWGTSRFAREGNNYFGEWCFSKGCGMVPARRDDGATHEVEAFDSPRDSVHSYMRNLNTLQAYANLRALRQHLRKTHKPLNANLLAIGLAQYSERGRKYVKSIRTFIHVNRKAMHAAASSEAKNQTAMGALITASH